MRWGRPSTRSSPDGRRSGARRRPRRSARSSSRTRSSPGCCARTSPATWRRSACIALRRMLHRRYASAAALAEDLERFLAGQSDPGPPHIVAGTTREVGEAPARADRPGRPGGDGRDRRGRRGDLVECLAPGAQRAAPASDRTGQALRRRVGSAAAARPGARGAWPTGTCTPPSCGWPARRTTSASSSGSRRSCWTTSTGPAPGIATSPGGTSGGSAAARSRCSAATRRRSAASSCPPTAARWPRATRRAASSSGTRTRDAAGPPCPGHAGPAEWLAFSPDGRILASAGGRDRASASEKEILLWDVAGGRLIARQPGVFADEIRMMAFMDGGRLLAVVSRDARDIRTIRAWDVAAGRRAAAAALRHRRVRLRHALSRRAILCRP